MKTIKVEELMCWEPEFIEADALLIKAAEKMHEIDCGILPVGTESEIEGIITDRDIVLRCLAQGKDPAQENVRNCMSKRVYSCREKDTLEQAAEEMRRHKVSRLLVKDEHGDVTGILTFGHILRNNIAAGQIAHIVNCAVERKAA